MRLAGLLFVGLTVVSSFGAMLVAINMRIDSLLLGLTAPLT